MKSSIRLELILMFIMISLTIESDGQFKIIGILNTSESDVDTGSNKSEIIHEVTKIKERLLKIHINSNYSSSSGDHESELSHGTEVNKTTKDSSANIDVISTNVTKTGTANSKKYVNVKKLI